MWQFVEWCADMTERTYNCINMVSVNMGGIKVGYADIFIGAIAIGMFVSIFWKGARG